MAANSVDSGRARPEFASNSPAMGKRFPKFGPTSARVGTCWPGSTGCRSNLADIATTSGESGAHPTHFGQPRQTSADVDQVWAEHGQSSAEVGQIGPSSPNFGKHRSTLDKRRPNSTAIVAKLYRIREKTGRNGPKLGRVWSYVARTSPNVAPSWPMPGKFRPKLAKHRSTWVDMDICNVGAEVRYSGTVTDQHSVRLVSGRWEAGGRSRERPLIKIWPGAPFRAQIRLTALGRHPSSASFRKLPPWRHPR